MRSETEKVIVRVLFETLKASKNEQSVDFLEIVTNSQTTGPVASRVLSRFLEVSDNHVLITPWLRVLLAIELSRLGRLKEAARALTWREFERFARECLEGAGFRTEWNVRVKGQQRSWQVDVVGIRGDLMLTVDCKHWNTPNYESRLKGVAEEQRAAAACLLRSMTVGPYKQRTLQGLVTILTLSEPRSKFLKNTVLISIEQFANFLSAVSPFDTTLPLITESTVFVQNPMSQYNAQ